LRVPGPPSGRLFALRVVLFAATVPLLLRRDLTRLGRRLEPAAPKALPPPPPPAEVLALVERIDRLLSAFRPLVRSGCLTRGITLFYFLRRAGAPVSLHFGIGSTGAMGEVDGGFSGHCWVVHDGLPLAEKRDPRPLFAEMFRIPERP
jgi:hypothetical protein